MTLCAIASLTRTGPASRLLRGVGTTVCLLALAVTVGGHWMALQSVAWGTMIVDFARQDSLTEALRKTFDGRHPCSLCRQVQQGRQHEREEQRRHPLIRAEHFPEFLAVGEPVVAPPPASAGSPHTPYGSDRHPQFVPAPPTPPPRAA